MLGSGIKSLGKRWMRWKCLQERPGRGSHTHPEDGGSGPLAQLRGDSYKMVCRCVSDHFGGGSLRVFSFCLNNYQHLRIRSIHSPFRRPGNPRWQQVARVGQWLLCSLPLLGGAAAITVGQGSRILETSLSLTARVGSVDGLHLSTLA